jgi:steroid delta-isomerase-like uncharacterized protein
MSKESKNKAVIRHNIEEALNKGDLSAIDKNMTGDYAYHSPMGEYKGPEGFRQMINMMRNAFPDIHAHIDDIVAEGDTVATRTTYTGTFKNGFMGIAPTGKKFTMTGTVISHFTGGKEKEAWGSIDMLSFYRQLGIPIPQQ